MGNFYQDVIVRSLWFAEAHKVCKDPALLEPGFRAKVEGFVVEAAVAGHKLLFAETYRSQARQQQLYAQGRTAPGLIVTRLQKVGVHGYGLAVDFGLFDTGKYDPKGEHYQFLADLCKEHRLISGINWGTPGKHTPDWGHVQGVPLFRQEALFAGTWYPGPGYDPVQDEIDHGVAVV